MLVAGVDSSTQSCKVVLCDADDGTVVGRGSAPHLGTGSAAGEGTACGLARRDCRLAGRGEHLTPASAWGTERPGSIAIPIRHLN
jgi:hypothetical protein